MSTEEWQKEQKVVKVASAKALVVAEREKKAQLAARKENSARRKETAAKKKVSANPKDKAATKEAKKAAKKASKAKRKAKKAKSKAKKVPKKVSKPVAKKVANTDGLAGRWTASSSVEKKGLVDKAAEELHTQRQIVEAEVDLVGGHKNPPRQ